MDHESSIIKDTGGKLLEVGEMNHGLIFTSTITAERLIWHGDMTGREDSNHIKKYHGAGV